MCNILNKLKVVSKMLNETSSAIECKTTDMKETVMGLKVVCTELLNVVCKLDDLVNKSENSTAGASSSSKERNSESMSNFIEKISDNIREKFKYKCNQCDKLFRGPTFKEDHIKVVPLGIRFNCPNSSCKKKFHQSECTENTFKNTQ